MSERLQAAIGQAIHDEFWHMEGGDGPAPTPANAGDLQLAWAILQLPEIRQLLALRAMVEGRET